jgi:hypothetical protein
MMIRERAKFNNNEYELTGIEREVATTDYSSFSQFKKITLPRLKWTKKHRTIY